jgi:hypothetical protein
MLTVELSVVRFRSEMVLLAYLSCPGRAEGSETEPYEP